jgi:hypothetical protein
MHSTRRVTRRQFVTTAGAATGALFIRTPPGAAAGQDPVVDAVPVKGKTENRARVSWRGVGKTDRFYGHAELKFYFLCLHASQPALMEVLHVEYQPPEF